MTTPLPAHDTAGYRAILRRLAGLDAEAAANRAEAVSRYLRIQALDADG